MRQARVAASLGIVMVLSACATGLRPAEDAATLAGPGAAAVGTEAGVRLEIRPDVEHPRPLDRPLIAMYVVVENRSDRDLVVRPHAFDLIDEAGRRYPAIPADDLRRSAESSVEADIALAMRSLPHDPLAAGGRTDGFLYFDQINDTQRLTLSFELRAKDSGARSVRFQFRSKGGERGHA